MDAIPFSFLFSDETRPGDASESDDLLRHLEPMYAFAQVLTLDADRAMRLVEDTYLAARNAATVGRVDRAWLFRTMRALHTSADAAARVDAEPDTDESPRLFAQQYNIKQRLVDPFLRHAAPVALASLGERDRTLLMLCDAERMSCSDAARVLMEPAEIVCRQLDSARKAYRMTIHAQASPMLRELLNTVDPREWGPASVRRAIKSEFGNLPPTLEPAIKSALADARTASNESVRRRRVGGDEARPTIRTRLMRAVLPLTLILMAGLLGYIGQAALQTPDNPNVIAMAARHADDATLSLTTDSPEQAAAHVRERLNWRLNVPTIDDAALLGAGVSELASGIAVPTFIYADRGGPSEQRVVLYALSYALLDRHADRLFLERSILTAIADDSHFDLLDLSDDNKVLIWRHADDIYLAVTRGDATGLKDRIRF